MFKTYIKNIIYFLIQLIEKYEFRNFNPNEEDIMKKFVNTIFLDNEILVETDYGMVPITEMNITQPFQRYKLELENGLWLECADTHMLFCSNHEVKMLIDLTTNDYILTKSGESKVKKISKLKTKVSMFDLSIDTPEMSYYTNDILSHNTVSAAIVLIHFVLFNDDKGCMVVANKGKTVKEIIRKIKDIYKLIPFFLKKGVTNWNETQIAFENNSRIQTENRTKDPSIGFTIDFLYLDEFAHIPDNFIRDYYGAIIPVVSSVNNSHIVITSTPNGYNMFWELFTNAELPEDDPLKNPYKAMRVLWNQVPGREDTKIKMMDVKLKKFNMSKSHILREIREKYDITFYKKHVGEDVYDCVEYDVTNEKTYIDNIRKIRINGIPLPELAIVSNWKEEETKLLLSPDKFDQEYGLHFVTGDKILFNKEQIDLLKSNQISFDYTKIQSFERFKFPYDNLKFVKDNNLFNLARAKEYYNVISIDLSEGLAKDFSVINIFRLVLRDKNEIEKYQYDNMYDLFKLEQIGLFRNNLYSIRELAHILYLIVFELLDPEKTKIVLEYNTYGAELLAHLPNVFDGKNNYSNSVFLRYKHNKEDAAGKIGLKLSKDKHLIIDKEFQQSVRNKKMIIHSEINIKEITTFSKHETTSGIITYKAESGNDDVVMTTITLSTALIILAIKI